MSKSAPNPEEAPTEAAPVGSKKKKIILFGIIFAVILGIGGGAAAFFLGGKGPAKKEVKKVEKEVPGVFLPLDSFVVNLQSENGDKYLQTSITLQVRNEEQLNFYKGNMPQLRSRLLLLLSNKTAEDLLTSQGKLKLAAEITKQTERPYGHNDPTPKEKEERKVLGVFFTSFMIQ